jgi:hypothetical protein
MSDQPYLLDICEKLKANQNLNKYNITLLFLGKTKSMITSHTNSISIVRKGKTPEEKLVYNPRISYDEYPITFSFQLKYEISGLGLIHTIKVTPISYDDNYQEDEYGWPIGEGKYVQKVVFGTVDIEAICSYIINKEDEIHSKNEYATKYLTVNQHYCTNCKKLLR